VFLAVGAFVISVVVHGTSVESGREYIGFVAFVLSD